MATIDDSRVSGNHDLIGRSEIFQINIRQGQSYLRADMVSTNRDGDVFHYVLPGVTEVDTLHHTALEGSID